MTSNFEVSKKFKKSIYEKIWDVLLHTEKPLTSKEISDLIEVREDTCRARISEMKTANVLNEVGKAKIPVGLSGEEMTVALYSRTLNEPFNVVSSIIKEESKVKDIDDGLFRKLSKTHTYHLRDRLLSIEDRKKYAFKLAFALISFAEKNPQVDNEFDRFKIEPGSLVSIEDLINKIGEGK